MVASTAESGELVHENGVALTPKPIKPEVSGSLPSEATQLTDGVVKPKRKAAQKVVGSLTGKKAKVLMNARSEKKVTTTSKNSKERSAMKSQNASAGVEARRPTRRKSIPKPGTGSKSSKKSEKIATRKKKTSKRKAADSDDESSAKPLAKRGRIDAAKLGKPITKAPSKRPKLGREKNAPDLDHREGKDYANLPIHCQISKKGEGAIPEVESYAPALSGETNREIIDPLFWEHGQSSVLVCPEKQKIYVRLEVVERHDNVEVKEEGSDQQVHPTLRRSFKVYELHSKPDSEDYKLIRRVLRLGIITHEKLKEQDPLYDFGPVGESDDQRVFGPYGIVRYIEHDAPYPDDYYRSLFGTHNIVLVNKKLMRTGSDRLLCNDGS